MELSTAMHLLQGLVGLIFVGFVGRLFFTPKAWKPREHSLDEYLEAEERNGARRR